MEADVDMGWRIKRICGGVEMSLVVVVGRKDQQSLKS